MKIFVTNSRLERRKSRYEFHFLGRPVITLNYDTVKNETFEETFKRITFELALLFFPEIQIEVVGRY